ncbi:MAG TPA: hypothetical protein VLA20_08880 [Vicinamibacterales bacterium]|nr:hypothetical protein [Vicinamibacterales bacterium]
MTTHFGVMLLYAAAISVVFGTLLRDDVPSQLRLGARIFIGLMAGAYLVGWLLYLAFA